MVTRKLQFVTDYRHFAISILPKIAALVNDRAYQNRPTCDSKCAGEVLEYPGKIVEPLRGIDLATEECKIRTVHIAMYEAQKSSSV